MAGRYVALGPSHPSWYVNDTAPMKVISAIILPLDYGVNSIIIDQNIYHVKGSLRRRSLHHTESSIIPDQPISPTFCSTRYFTDLMHLYHTR
jgi:hypothetical protein